ncbi:MAG: hypothetical protein HQM16_16870 [Deltaproteobacteria bacterium]|nr:hypothetical protein [Deltaproteobacteria bacterium]
MQIKRQPAFFWSLVFLIAFFPVLNLQAGGPLYISTGGLPAIWDTTVPVIVHPESGVCGTFSNSEILSRLDLDLAVWGDVTGVSLSFQQVTLSTFRPMLAR